MSRHLIALLSLSLVLGLTACQSPEEPETAKKETVAAAPLTVPISATARKALSR